MFFGRGTTYWTSTARASFIRDQVWNVNFGDGGIFQANADEEVVAGFQLLAIAVRDGEVVSPPTPVTIDIKPGEFPNLINIGNDPNRIGVITVAILTKPTFDATGVDPTTVRFGKTGTEAAPVQVALQDADGNGTLDLVLHFRTQDTSLQCGDTSAVLTGKTVSGEAIQGSDSIVTVRGGIICP
jgi:hypothetical protein